MSDVNTTGATPNIQAYALETLNSGFKGRFSPNSANIRKFQDNPYILEMSNVDRAAANLLLLVPHHGEMFYDDENFKWFCRYEVNAEGIYEYKYYSKEKEVNDKYEYLKSQGVFNQLMSAWNNGRIYCFYLDVNKHAIYPNSALTFPEEYATYTVKRQSQIGDTTAVYVAGQLVDGELNNVHIAMKSVSNVANSTTATRMGIAMTFSSADATMNSYEPMVPGQFYVVDYYNTAGVVVDTKLFQAVESIVENASQPSQTVVDLKVQVIRAGLSMAGANDVYPITSGEDVTSDLSFVVEAIYNDGTRKLITSEINSNRLVITGMEDVNSSAAIGTTTNVKFTYYPSEMTGDTTEVSKSTTITFQVVAASYTELYRVIPVIQKVNNYNSGELQQHQYHLKVYCLNKDGVIENRSKAFYDTFQQQVTVDGSLTFQKCNLRYLYDYTKQSIMFLLDSAPSDAIFKFSLYSGGKSFPLMFKAKFTNIDIAAGFVGALDDVNHGYDVNTGLFRDLSSTVNNKVVYNPAGGVAGTLNITCENGTGKFTTKYRRSINGQIIRPVLVQGYSVSDNMFSLITSTKLINSEDSQLQISLKEVFTSTGVSLNNGEFILIKYISSELDGSICTDFDIYMIQRS